MTAAKAISQILLVSSSKKKEDKKGPSILILIICICFSLIFYMLWLILSKSYYLSSPYSAAASNLKSKAKIPNWIDYDAVRTIHFLYTDGRICTYADMKELEFFFCKFVKNGKFMTKGEIFVRVQDDPFNFTGDYLDLVYYSLYRSYKSDNNPTTPKPPNQDNEEISKTLPQDIVGKLIKPCDGKYTSMWGGRYHPVTGKYDKHTGLDICGTWHQPIKSTADGVVVSTNTSVNGYGNYIKIKHTINNTTFYSFYAHLSNINVNVGDKVVKGQAIGREGGDPNKDINPGTSTGHHLHFEIRLSPDRNSNIDPYPYLK